MIALLLTIIVIGIVSCFLLPYVSTKSQVFTDLIIENTALSGLNKSGELKLFWCMLFFGLALMVICYIIFYKKATGTDNTDPKSEGSRRSYIPLFCTLIPLVTRLVFFGSISYPLLFCLLIVTAGIFMERVLPYGMEKGFCTRFFLMFILTYYALTGVLTLLTRLSLINGISSFTHILITLIFTVLFIGFTMIGKGDKNFRYIFLGLQLLIPLVLLVFTVDRYEYEGNIIRIPYAPFYYVFYYALIILAFVGIMILAFKRLKNPDPEIDAASLVSRITPMIIFVYHSFSAAPLYAQPDQHHHGEQMIPFNQIFTFGLKPYEEYTPVSGLFPLFNGSISHGLLRGTVTDYPSSITVMMTLICLLTIYLIAKHTGSCFALITAVLYTLPCYNRQYLVLPSLLILALPSLIKKRALWMETWVLLSLIGGLYYPLFGAAVMLGALPLALYQFISILKERSFKSEIKNRSVIILGICLLISIILLAPMLLRMAKHMTVFSSQSVLADGIPIWGQDCPEFFLPFIKASAFKNKLYLLIRFLLPMTGVWAFFAVSNMFSGGRKPKDILRDQNLMTGLLVLASGAIALMISYSYTLIRADKAEILSRSSKILVAMTAVFLPVMLYSAGKNLLSSKYTAFIIGLLLSVPFILYHDNSALKNPGMWVYPDGEAGLVMDDSTKLFNFYKVPDTFIKTTDLPVSERYKALIGDGFMVGDQVHYIEEYAALVEKCEAVEPGIGFMEFDGLGFYDYLGVRCPASGFLPAARSKEAMEEYYYQAMHQRSGIRPVIIDIDPVNSYYFFRNMINDGYIYSSVDKAFLPEELYDKLYPSDEETPSDMSNDLRRDAAPVDLGLCASSFGKSLYSLSKIMSVTDPVAENGVISGNEYDILAIDLNRGILNNGNGYKIFLSWEDENGDRFDGNLVCFDTSDSITYLVPMGMEPCWYLSRVNDLTISVYTSDLSEKLYETTYKKLCSGKEDTAFISNMRFYHLN